MASENAAAVAAEIMEKVRKGEKINKQQIQKKHGYSASSAKSMKAMKTKTYQKKIKPIIQAMIEERNAAIAAMKRKRSKAKYRDLTDAIDKFTKNIQLLGGQPTEQIKLYGWEGEDNNLQSKTMDTPTP